MFRIGSIEIASPYLLAPMAGVSEMPYRVLCMEMGAGLATTELISSKGIFYKNTRTRQYLTYDAERERPYSLQLFGGDEESMCFAAVEAVKHGAQIIDVNMGCPVKKVTRSGAGSSLSCDPARAGRLVAAMVNAVGGQVPITAKIRSGWDANTVNASEMARALEDGGAAAVAVHPRTRAQGYAGKADWAVITQMVQAVQIPVIGNGDVNTAADAKRMLEETGCAAVMIGRGALGNPWIFEACSQGSDFVPSPEQRRDVVSAHFTAHIAFHRLLSSQLDASALKRKRVTPEEMAVRTFRQHALWYSRGLPQSAAFRGKVVTLETPEAVLDHLTSFFAGLDPEALPEAGELSLNYKLAFG